MKPKHSLTNVPEQDHDAMRAASMHPIEGEAATRTLAASGGGELPGRERPDHPRHVPPDVATGAAVHEPIPGEHDASTAVPRQPGAVGGRFNGADLPSNDGDPSLDDRVARERGKEGGKP